jgi:dTDP-4-dehydrorhamnose 3,5-epimerase
MESRPSRLPGCVELRPTIHRDSRGSFAKPFHASTFEALGLATGWKELFYSASGRGVVRGLHFQVPPAAQAKLVCCLAGEVLDVVVDVRAGSPTYGCFDTFLLNGKDMRAVFVPEGCAHGFAALTDGAVVAYAVTHEHDPEHDTGLRWDSVPGIPWPFAMPTVSERDAALPAFESFTSPFTYGSDNG